MARLFGLFGDDEKDTEQVEQVEMADEVAVADVDVDVDVVAADIDHVDDGKLRLRQEELDVSKYSVRTGEVTLHKDIVEEQKTVHVPVTHEQVVIERRAVNEHSDIPVGEEEVIRIPVSEERVSVGKHTVVTGEVELHKRSIEEVREVNETLRKEEARLDVDGNPDIVNESGVDLR
jgi:uncharacterized protein (TIGR02271 family)